jgi:hypothetical protein
VCREAFDPRGFAIHALSCKKVSGYSAASRHAHVKNMFKYVLRQYGFNPDHAEPRFSNGKGPDVIFQLGGVMTMVDVTIRNPLAETYVDKEVASPGRTLEVAEGIKNTSYLDQSLRRGMAFTPLALSVHGGIGPQSARFLKSVAQETADPVGFMRHMTSALAVAIQVGNARMVLAAREGLWSSGLR